MGIISRGWGRKSKDRLEGWLWDIVSLFIFSFLFFFKKIFESGDVKSGRGGREGGVSEWSEWQ